MTHNQFLQNRLVSIRKGFFEKIKSKYLDPPPSYEEVVEGRKPPFQSQLTFCTSETSNETLVRPSFQSHSFGRSFSSTIANERNFRKVIFS